MGSFVFDLLVVWLVVRLWVLLLWRSFWFWCCSLGILTVALWVLVLIAWMRVLGLWFSGFWYVCRFDFGW